MTLPEVLIAMVITSVVTSVLLMGMVAVYRGHNFTQQDSASLGALRTSLDRFEKEVRQGRIIYSDSNGKRVHLWVDDNHDNQQNLDEKILWEIEEDPEEPVGSNRAQLTRATEAAPTPVVVSKNLVFDFESVDPESGYFVYNALDPEEATLITVRFVAQVADSPAGERTVTTRVRLRNANFENE